MFKQIIKHMQDNKTRARIDLLGEQWFMGRTGEKKTSAIKKVASQDKLQPDEDTQQVYT